VRDTATGIDKLTLQGHLAKDGERLHRYIAAKVPSDLRSVISADDILQEVCIAAFRGASSFRADGPGALTRWMTTLANRKLLDALKSARALKRRGQYRDLRIAERRESSMIDLFARIAPHRRTPSSEAATKEAVQAVRTALAGLPDDRRQAVWMRHIEGRSVADVARAMRRTVPAVHSLLFRARMQLGERLGRASKYFTDARSSETNEK
jgi:RNA polymerase sigma-70 factor (ECF subfamily)